VKKMDMSWTLVKLKKIRVLAKLGMFLFNS